MNKKEAREMLNVNQTKLADVLCISKSHLSRIKTLSAAQVKIVQGEMARIILLDAAKTIERLEKENEELKKKLEDMLTAAGVTLPN